MSQQSPSTSVRRFETGGGAQIFQLLLHEFPQLWGFAYLILFPNGDGGEYRVLVDTGSGFGDSNLQLEAGLSEASAMLGKWIGLGDLTHILITHAHIDHIGGLTHIRPRTNALVGVHELDLRNLTNYEERVVVVSRRLGEFLAEAGVSAERSSKLLEMYKFLKGLYSSVKVDFTYEAAGMRLGPIEMLHVPGHCAGHVVLRLHDVLLSGDHVLSEISPHQAPEKLTHYTGLGHYLESLDKLEGWSKGVRLTVGGHNQEILDLPGRLKAIRDIHTQRLQRVMETLQNARTIFEVSHVLFGEVNGYNVLLALEEAGAHVEYLYQRGLLGIENLSEIEKKEGNVPLRYRCLKNDGIRGFT